MKIFLLLVLFFIVGCQENTNNKVEDSPLVAIQVDYGELREMQNHSHVVLLDVRSEEEYQQGHIQGALSIPLDELVWRLDELRLYDEVIVYCNTNIRSQQAFDFLKIHFDEVYIYYEGYEKCCR